MRYKEEYLRALADCEDSFTGARYRWLERLVLEDRFSLNRLYLCYGYVMAVRDSGKYVSDLIRIFQDMIEEENKINE